MAAQIRASGAPILEAFRTVGDVVVVMAHTIAAPAEIAVIRLEIAA